MLGGVSVLDELSRPRFNSVTVFNETARSTITPIPPRSYLIFSRSRVQMNVSVTPYPSYTILSSNSGKRRTSQGIFRIKHCQHVGLSSEHFLLLILHAL